MKKILKIHRSIVIIIGIIAAITLLALTTGLRLCIVRTTSMEPTITPYSVCLVTTRVRYEDLSIGDIVFSHVRPMGKKSSTAWWR